MEWMTQAACAATNTDSWFFDEDGGDSMSEWKSRQVMLVRVCADCPVWNVCRAYAVGDTDGVFGGTSRGIRRQMRSELGIASPDEGRAMGTRVAELIDEGYSFSAALKESGLPEHDYFYNFEAYAHVAS